MKILYACNFSLKNSGGRDRATRQKLKALKLQVDDLYIISSEWNPIFKFIDLFNIEIRSIITIFKNKPDVFISRGYIGFFGQKVCKYYNIKTVREIHADMLGELSQTNKSYLEKKVILPLSLLSLKIDKQADMRIFNHPDLKKWFEKTFFTNKNDTFVYNGFSEDGKSLLSVKKAKQKFNFSSNNRYLIFIGAASYWHGVDYLVALQKQLNYLNSNIKIVCGGGEISVNDDPERLLTNITPLNDIGCADLVQAADVCLLPVRQSRVSPGSPLKLYDYILHKKFIISQQNVRGYSDEIEKYKHGFLVDYEDTVNTAEKINKLKIPSLVISDNEIEYFSWKVRMSLWCKSILDL